MKKKSFTIGMVIILFFSVLSAAGTSHADLSGEVKVALNWDPTTVNMLDVKLGIDLTPVLHMHQALMSADIGTGERSFRNALAQSAEVLENGKDIKFIMKRGNIFHTGDPVTARDVKFTYEQCVNPSNANLMAGPLDEIEEVEVLDDYTFIFRFYEPYAAWQSLLWIGICSKNYYEKVGKEQFAKKPVGSGAFRFVNRQIGESVTLEADENYRWKEDIEIVDKTTGKTVKKEIEKKVEFKTLKFTTISDEITRLAMPS